MRVIAGKFRSRPLHSLRGMDLRPTSDRLRETLFNVLAAGNPTALEGKIWLDLFAGTGAVAIELLSQSLLLKPDAVVVAEHTKRFDPGDDFAPLHRYRLLKQGDAALSFYGMKSTSGHQRSTTRE